MNKIDKDKVIKFIKDLPLGQWTTTKNNEEVIKLLKEIRGDFFIELADDESKFRKMPIPDVSKESLSKFSKEKLIDIVLQQNRIIQNLKL